MQEETVGRMSTMEPEDVMSAMIGRVASSDPEFQDRVDAELIVLKPALLKRHTFVLNTYLSCQTEHTASIHYLLRSVKKYYLPPATCHLAQARRRMNSM
jgi:hypothetical protein